MNWAVSWFAAQLPGTKINSVAIIEKIIDAGVVGICVRCLGLCNRSAPSRVDEVYV